MVAASGSDAGPDPQRRALLAALAASCLAPLSLPASAAAGEGFDAFLAVSRVITARASLDAGQAALLYDSLVRNAPALATDVQALRSWLQEHKVEGGDLQRLLDAQKSPLAGLPRTIATAWYTGIVGEGGRRALHRVRDQPDVPGRRRPPQAAELLLRPVRQLGRGAGPVARRTACQRNSRPTSW